MSSTEISIIVLTCHRPERCRDSLQKNQAALAHRACEWWVINNGSADFRLPAALRSTTHLVHMPHNIGTAARNRARPAGRYVLMLDDDAYIQRETIDAAVEELEAHPTASGVILPVEGEGCLLQTVFHGCAVLFSAAALNLINGYPEHYLYYGEEYDVAFRMAAANFYMRPTLQGVPPVRHLRDPKGRNTDHILYRLVRNNAFCWMRCLPAREILPALADTLYRYHRVAKKEGAQRGFWRGARATPYALWRGARHRIPMNTQQFETMALLHEIDALRPEANDSPLIVCGIGKFMRTTLRRLKKNGWTIAAIAETNPAFIGRRFAGIAVCSTEEALSRSNCAVLTGLLAAPHNDQWRARLSERGYCATATGPIELFRQPAVH